MIDIYYYFIFTLIFLVAILLAVLFVGNDEKVKKEQETHKGIIDCCVKSHNINETVNLVFKMIASIIKADEYAFYMVDAKNSQFTLKSVRFKSEPDNKLNVSYSGLIPHKKQKYFFPLAISIDKVKTEMCIIEVEKAKLLNIPIKGGNALIQLKLVSKFSLKKNVKKQLESISHQFEPVVAMMMSIEQLNNRIKILETSKQAIRSIVSIINGEGIYKMAVGLFAKTISAKGGFFLKQESEEIELMVDTGFSNECEVMFKYDSELHLFLKEVLGDKKIAIISKNDNNFENIPVYLVSEGVKQLILFNINYGQNRGIAGFWYGSIYEMDSYQLSSLLLMFSKIAEVFKNPLRIADNSNDSVKTLKLISTLVDDLSPYTLGFSSLMEYYAGGIANELKLPLSEIRDIELAAYLSNIGIAALSYDIFLAKGKYSEYDYEVIKLHSEVGADIIEAINGDVKVANMIRYHHERIDGCGYPYGIKGNEIPIGAKVLAIAQFFVAKISPRNFREASTYDEAIEAIKQVSDTQLDSNGVDALLKWLYKTRKEKASCEGSLDHCWNMRFVSGEICNKCPVKFQTDKKCWEVSGNLCIAHGNKCETCFIYTEYVGRKNIG